MRVGISLTSRHDVADPREGARWMIERAQAARRAGLDSLFVKQRPSAFEESFAIVKKLLAGETVSSQGRFVVEHARVAPRPSEPVEYWIGAGARVSIDRAARIADGWLASPSLTLEQAREQAVLYLDGCAKYGKKPRAVAIKRDIYVGESSAEAEAVGQAIVKAGYRGFDPKALCWGSVADVAEKLCALSPLGYTDIIVRHLTDDHPKVLGSLARLAEVRKALQIA